MTQSLLTVPEVAPQRRPGRFDATGQLVRDWFGGSPGRLRLIAVGAVTGVVVAALLGGWALQIRAAALDRAAATSEHLLLLQNIQIKLVQADADATNAFLRGGLEPQDQRLDYIDALSQASDELAIAARHSSADASALGTVNSTLTRYAGYISSARANNRQGLPVGANYLTVASDLLRSEDGIPLLQARTQADTADLKDAFSDAGSARWLLLLAAVIGLGALAYAQLLLTRRSHRYVNLPAAASTVVLLGLLIGAAAVMVTAQSAANDVRDGALAQARSLSSSRVAAFDAKSEESLTLVSRGSATEDDELWTTAYNEAVDQLGSVDADAATALAGYGDAHAKINQTDLDGDWDAAVELAVSTADGSSNALFTQYDNLTEQALNEEPSEAADRLAEVGDRLMPTAVLLLVLGLLCAAGAWWGVSLRLDEYR